MGRLWRSVKHEDIDLNHAAMPELLLGLAYTLQLCSCEDKCVLSKKNPKANASGF
jgi:hypothetical protein